MDVIGVVASVVYQFCTNAAFLLLCALRTDHHPRHDEHHQPRAWRTDDDVVSVRGPQRLAEAGERRSGLRRSLVAFVAVGIFGAVLRSDYRPALLRQGTGGAGRHLGRESLVLSQGFLLLFGPFMPPIQIPEGNIALGQYSFSYYWISMFLIAALLVAALWWICNRTDIGLQARATMQNPAMARALGVDTRRIYMMTFTLRRGARGTFRSVARANDIHHALHGPAIRGPRLHYGRCRQGRPTSSQARSAAASSYPS